MRKRVIFIYFLLCLASGLSCRAQRVPTAEELVQQSGGRLSFYEGIYREKFPMLTPISLKYVKPTEKSRIVVKYDADIRLDSLSTDRAKDQILTLIGTKTFESYGLWFWKDCLFSTAYYAKGEENNYFQSLYDSLGDRPKEYKALLNWFVYRNLATKMVTDKHSLPLRRGAIEYEEPLQKMSWTMSMETKEILGYECQKAETDFHGRHWTVWFAPEIPVDCGFWKFSGLPGLIMEASSADSFYFFSAVSIENREMDLTYPKESKRLSREQFRKMESTVFANPISGSTMDVEKGQDYLIGGRLVAGEPKDTDHNVFTPNNYLGLYFPMELE